MQRRRFLTGILGLSALPSGCRLWPSDGFVNSCNQSAIPSDLIQHPLMDAVWQGLDSRQYWDCHTHLLGTGDSDSGIWLNPDMQSLLSPKRYIQFRFYMNGACANLNEGQGVDESYINRLLHLYDVFPPGARSMLLAFDYAHLQSGEISYDHSTFYTPNQYAAEVARRYPERFEWIASVHPYRVDAIQRLKQAALNGARAIKWLPAAMGIDPSDRRCVDFYDHCVKLNMPIITHAGEENAVRVFPHFSGNPLQFIPALERGVRIIFAHCASLGHSVVSNKNGKTSKEIANIDLFARLIQNPEFEGLVWGDTSGIIQSNRGRAVIERIITEHDWHRHLLNGSDYPLPGVMPLFSTWDFVNWGYLSEQQARLLAQIRHYNPLLYDFALKRSLRVKGHKFAESVFQTRHFFIPEDKHSSPPATSVIAN